MNRAFRMCNFQIPILDIAILKYYFFQNDEKS